MSSTQTRSRWLDWDRLGIGLSGLCAVHCLLTPVVLSLLPLWPTLQAVNAWVHPTLLVLILPVVLGALRRARRTGRIATACCSGADFSCSSAPGGGMTCGAPSASASSQLLAVRS